MTNTDRATTVSLGGDASISGIENRESPGRIVGPDWGPSHSASPKSSCQGDQQPQPLKERDQSSSYPSRRNANDLAKLPSASWLQSKSRSNSGFRLLVLNENGLPLPEIFIKQVLRIDADAKILNSWNSVCDRLARDWSFAPHVILGVSRDCSRVPRRLNDLYRVRVDNNYSPHPLYLAIPKNCEFARSRFEIERLGGYFLPFVDASARLRTEIEQMRLMIDKLKRSLPKWLVVYEGNAVTLQAVVFLVHRKRLIRVRGSGRQIAALAVCLKHNGLRYSFSGWQKILADDPLFEPAGGAFRVPNIGTIKMYFHRDFPKNLQWASDEYCSGFSVNRLIEVSDPGTHMTQYGIRGECDAIRK